MNEQKKMKTEKQKKKIIYKRSALLLRLKQDDGTNKKKTSKVSKRKTMEMVYSEKWLTIVYKNPYSITITNK